jgi:DNA-binding NarL/FixJ family response regulator
VTCRLSNDILAVTGQQRRDRNELQLPYQGGEDKHTTAQVFLEADIVFEEEQHDSIQEEREVLALMAEGRSNSAIAQRLFIAEKAVSEHCNVHLRQAGPAA